MAEEGHRVLLNVYDLSQGLARQLSSTFLGKPIEGIWHTGVVVYGNEYYFGGGIQHDPAGRTPYGMPVRVVELGTTHVPKEVFEDYLKEISPRYTAETYRLLSHNCNNFSNEVAQFLVGATIPENILQLPNEVMSSPMGPFIMPMIQQLETTLRSGAVPQAPQFVPTSANTHTSASNLPSRPIKLKDSDGSANKIPEKAAVLQVPSSVQPRADTVKASVSEDPLGEAWHKVQDEIIKEFAAIMATGTVRASEAATLATRRVMQRYGRLDVQG